MEVINSSESLLATTMDAKDNNFTNNSNWNSEYQQLLLDFRYKVTFLHYLWGVTTPALFCVIMAIGSLGNVLVIFVILQNRKMKTLTNFLLLNLAFADLLFLWICLPFQAYKFATFDFPAGDVVCKLVQYFLYVSVYVTVWTLVSISALRYISVVKPRCASKITNKNSVIFACSLIWAVLMVANIPTMLVHRVVTRDKINYCGMDPEYSGAVLWSFFVLAYIMPLTIVCALYVLLVKHLHKKNKEKSRESILRRKSMGQKRSMRAVKMLLVVVVVFALSWLPLQVHNLVSYFDKLPASMYYEVFRILWYCMAYGNSLANPIIYSFASEDFKKALRKSLSRCCICCWSSDDINNSSIRKSSKTVSLHSTNGGLAI